MSNGATDGTAKTSIFFRVKRGVSGVKTSEMHKYVASQHCSLCALAVIWRSLKNIVKISDALEVDAFEILLFSIYRNLVRNIRQINLFQSQGGQSVGCRGIPKYSTISMQSVVEIEPLHSPINVEQYSARLLVFGIM